MVTVSDTRPASSIFKLRRFVNWVALDGPVDYLGLNSSPRAVDVGTAWISESFKLLKRGLEVRFFCPILGHPIPGVRWAFQVLNKEIPSTNSKMSL